MRRQQFKRRFFRHAFRSHEQRHGSHNFGYFATVISLKTHITISANPHQCAGLIHHRQPGNTIFSTQSIHLSDSHIGAARNGICHHSGFGALDYFHILGLFFNGKITVQHPKPAFTSHGDCHASLGHGIHRRGHDRNIETDIASELGGGSNFRGDNIGGIG